MKLLFISDRLNKSILDPIHGLIKMTEEETEIISHELFNRLRKIRQNTFLYFVFPSANHTRFEHSIGVMHLASEMCLNAFQNASTLKRKRKKYNLENDKDIFSHDKFEGFEEIFWDLRIAALLHDIGHGPMSHQFDDFAPWSKDFIELVRADEKLFINGENLGLELANTFEKIFKAKKITEKRVEHEYVSYYFALIVLIEIGIDNKRIRRILSIMNDELKLTQVNTHINDKTYNVLPLLNQIVAGAPLDCDRMDYLLRDSYFTGVKYGTYDLNRLLKSLLPFIDNNQNIIRLGIKKSGLPAIENFLQARYELYVQVYFHKTNQACNTMLKHAAEKLEGSDFLNFESPEHFKKVYLDLSDEKFLEQMEKKLKPQYKEFASTITDLLNRRLWKRVLEVYPEPGRARKEDLDEMLDKNVTKITDKYPAMEPFVRKSLISSDPTKDLDEEKTVLLIKDEDENYEIDTSESWISHSRIFQALASKYMVGRVYIKVDSKEQESVKRFRNIKKKVLKEI